MTRIKESVAVVIHNARGEFLVTRRPADPADPLAGLWGFPAVTRRAASTLPAAASTTQMPVCWVNSFSTWEKPAVRLPA